MKDSFLKEIKERRSRDLAVLEELQNQIQELTTEAALIEQTIHTYDALLGGTEIRRGRKGRPPAKAAGKRGGQRAVAVGVVQRRAPLFQSFRNWVTREQVLAMYSMGSRRWASRTSRSPMSIRFFIS
jgi:hypothetical protein